MPSSPTDPASTAYPQDSAVSPAAVVTEVLAEQARRWRSGMPEPVEDWLRRHPLLRDNADAVLDLIYQEVLLRTEQGERPALEEYQGRFPSHAAALATLFEVHQAVEAGGEVGAESSLAESAWRTRLTLRDGMAPRAESPHAELLGAGLMSAPHVPGFEIVEQLGRGGMGVVYRARQLSLGRTVALKMVLAGAQARPEELTRLRREAEALARVPHPNIVQIHEIGEHGGGPYLALEFVEGGSLDRKLAGAPQPADAAARLVETLARAVEHAHRQGIIHRDLKPANVLLAADGTPKITDFGLARLGDRSGETRTGDVLGTPSYMAPEQAAGRAADIGPGADVYALGAILYELLTGRPPFRADNALETLRQVLEQEPVPPARLQASVPRDLDTICLKCLEKDRRRRYATAGALADDLQCFRERRPVLARPAPAWERGVKWARRRPALAALYSVAVVATVVLGLYTAWLYDALTETEKQRGVAQKARNDAESAAESRRQQLVRAHLADGARLLDDGDWHGALVPLAQALQLDDDDAARANAASAHIHRVRLAAILRQCPRLVCFWPHAGDVVLAELTPDGRHAVTAADRAVQVWDVAGGAEIKRMDHGATIRAAAVSPDGLRMATAAADRTVRVWETATGRLLAESAPLHDPLLRVAFGSAGRILIVTRKGIDAVEVHAWDAADDQTAALLLQTKTGPAFDLAVSPDGRRAATEHQGVVTVWDLESGAAVFTAGDGKSTLTAARFNPSGDVLAAADVSGAVRIWDVSLGAAGRELALIRPPGRPVRQLAFSVGNNLATGETDGVARVWSAGGKKQADLKHGAMFTHAVDCVAFSADGRRVVTAGVDKTARVWTADNAGAPLLWHGERVTAASFSPDCRLLLTVCAGGIVRIWDLAAGRLATPPLAHDDFISHAAFSEDGRRAATAGDDRTVRLWDLTTGKPHRKPLVHAFPVRQVSFGADCQVLTVAGDYSQGDGEACVWNAQGERKFHRATAQAFRGIVPTDRTVKRAWFSRDGRHVLTVNQTGIAQVWDTVTGQPTTEPLAHPSAVTGAAFSPDRRRVLTHTFLHAPAISVWEGAGRPLAELFRQVDPDNTVVVWDVAGGKPVARLGEPKSTTPYRHASFSPDGASLLVIDGTAHVWDIAAQQARRRFQKPGTAVVQAALDPAGRTLVTLSADRTAQLWDADEGSLIPTPSPFRHNDPVWPPQFSAHGLLLALGGPGGVRIWDAKTGDPVSPPLLQPGIVYSAAFSPDGDRLLTASDRAARLWPLTPASETVQDLLELAQFLSCTRLDRQAGHVAPMSRDELCAAWKKLRGKFSAHFTTPTSDVIAWHADEARMCERSQNKIGAALHRQRLRQAGGD